MHVWGQQLHVLLDTGATMNVISEQALQRLKANNRVSKDMVDSVAEPQASEMVRMADGSTIPHSGHIVTFAYVVHHTWEANDTFQVLPLQGYDVTLGIPWFQRYLMWISDTTQ